MDASGMLLVSLSFVFLFFCACSIIFQIVCSKHKMEGRWQEDVIFLFVSTLTTLSIWLSFFLMFYVFPLTSVSLRFSEAFKTFFCKYKERTCHFSCTFPFLFHFYTSFPCNIVIPCFSYIYRLFIIFLSKQREGNQTMIFISADHILSWQQISCLLNGPRYNCLSRLFLTLSFLSCYINCYSDLLLLQYFDQTLFLHFTNLASSLDMGN